MNTFGQAGRQVLWGNTPPPWVPAFGSLLARIQLGTKVLIRDSSMLAGYSISLPLSHFFERRKNEKEKIYLWL
ncbi:hypothetical protein LCGC14_1088460 [marine sediment metagenome]|uniref:Uncharacterized protein n=1 Tax=marine sediment metagenome TaxID=412755 RepID=A0A0F9MDB5_9ZZZZ